AQTPPASSFTLDLQNPTQNRALPPDLATLPQSLAAVTGRLERLLTPQELAALLPPDVEIRDVTRQGVNITSLRVARKSPPDVLALRMPQQIGRGQKYTVESSVSVASAEELREAGSRYPGWVTDHYLQLPEELPARVKDLAREVASSANNPYDKAKAIEAYLRNIPYSLQIEAPPRGRDGVDYFLFTQKKGYSDYHASAMVVMLRAVGIPARLATGYTAGDYDSLRKVYMVKESHGHAWPEVFFPRYGWVEFEPSPNQSPIVRSETPSSNGASSDFSEEDEGLGLEEEPEESSGGMTSTRRGREFPGPWGYSGLGLAVVAGLALLVRYAWLRNLASLAPAAQVYEKMCRLATWAGLPPRSSQTS
ncbi:MAG TPA: transglutaminase-like domain-containing protein, partial [Dehalococcoidia bacterium]|nr:transglutaminase-like domain-containing protein [Dehalococcoidia bacterium]